MERQGSGLSKIRTAYENVANYQPGLEPTFRFNRVEFKKLKNKNLEIVNLRKHIEEKLQEMLRDVEAGKNRAIVCYKLDHVGRK